jgi:hypothetical protein
MLSRASTADLTCELICRVIERERGVVAPIVGLIKLATTMASMLGAAQRYQIAGTMRDAADALEHETPNAFGPPVKSVG